MSTTTTRAAFFLTMCCGAPAASNNNHHHKGGAVRRLRLRSWFEALCGPFLVLTVALSVIAVSNYRQKQVALREILSGRWTLVSIDVPADGLQSSWHGGSRYTVSATFCDIDWNMHRANPAAVSFFATLKAKSPNCHSTLQTFDLYDLVQLLRQHDDEEDASRSSKVRILPPTGMIFHQSRCGSTLAANLLAAFAPEQTRVYSEPSAPLVALKACPSSASTRRMMMMGSDRHDNPSCHPDLHLRLIRDVFYVMGRAPADSDLNYVFYKSNSGGMYIADFTRAFPDVPWAYMFRDSVEVMQSHWKVPEEDLDFDRPDTKSVKCAQYYGLPNQPATTVAVLERAHHHHRNSTAPSLLSRTEYCAAHLASISLAVLQEHDRTGRGRFINYKRMPDVIWETLLPVDFGIPVPSPVIDHLRSLTNLYSKGHQEGRANELWHSDTDYYKKRNVSHNVTRAVAQFCPDTYERLDGVAERQRRQIVAGAPTPTNAGMLLPEQA